MYREGKRQSCSCPRPRGVWGIGCVVPLILDLGSSWMWVVNLTTWAFYLQRRTLLHEIGGLVSPQSRSGRFRENTCVVSAGIRSPDRQFRRLVTIPTMLTSDVCAVRVCCRIVPLTGRNARIFLPILPQERRWVFGRRTPLVSMC